MQDAATYDGCNVGAAGENALLTVTVDGGADSDAENPQTRTRAADDADTVFYDSRNYQAASGREFQTLRGYRRSDRRAARADLQDAAIYSGVDVGAAGEDALLAVTVNDGARGNA